jgi:hypothetical protein
MRYRLQVTDAAAPTLSGYTKDNDDAGFDL